MPAPRISVVIPCHNHARHLRESIGSVLGQTFEDAEIIVVDDASDDDSRAVAAAIAAENPARTIRVLHQSSRRSSIARNHGIEAARGELVFNLDADDWLDPRCLELLVAALDAAPRAAVAYPDQDHFGDAEEFYPARPYDFGHLLSVNFICAGSLFRRAAWEQVGGYATDIRYEDWDFWIRLGEAGHVGVAVPGAVFHYRRHGGQYVRNLERDDRIKAEFVHRRPHLYDDERRRWARRVREQAGESPSREANGSSRPAEVPLHALGGEPVAPRAVLAVTADPEVAAELAALGLDTRVVRARDVAELMTTAQRQGEEAKAEWVIALGTGERVAGPWPDLGLAESCAFAHVLGYDSMMARSSGEVPARVVAWRTASLGAPSSPCPFPLSIADGRVPTDAELAVELSRATRDHLLALAARGGAAVYIDGAASGRLVGRALALPEALPGELIDAAVQALANPSRALGALSGEQLQILLVVARLREAQLSVTGRLDQATAHRGLAAALEAAIREPQAAVDARGFVTLAFADELVVAPDLLGAYARAFTADDDATLVIYAPASSEEAVAELLGPALAVAGLDGPDSADLLAWCGAGAARALADAGHALLSRREPVGVLAALPRFDAGRVDALRGLAMRQWSRAAADVAS